MSPDERFDAALLMARSGAFRCAECYSCDVGCDWLPDGSRRVWVAHWLSPFADGWCPCVSGNYAAARRVSLDLLDTLAALAAPLAHYGEPMPFHRRQKVSVP